MRTSTRIQVIAQSQAFARARVRRDRARRLAAERRRYRTEWAESEARVLDKTTEASRRG